ncbi:hypothetical protein ETH_00039700, partial [Eimeria tenella]
LCFGAPRLSYRRHEGKGKRDSGGNGPPRGKQQL